MIRKILLDVDDTILDFGAAERNGITQTFRHFGLEPTEALLQRYQEINRAQWEAFERGELERDEVLTRRFLLLFGELGLEIDPQACEDVYRHWLGVGHCFVEGAEALLDYLYPKYELYIASNGVADTQYSRLESAGINRYFKEVFISETTGYHKPEKAYFDYCFARMPGFRPEETLIIGDSLTSDILGGINAGIRTCWFNPRHKPANPAIRPDFEVHSLKELEDIL
ncbi:MAG: YjjG family noncanonical pyrimidine nucleotidase [Oscillospiraceae bacterium]|nr:YjjG family noncanonical pyrimidine nucleotidase [Oscillospiraceae bacterium]